MLHLPARWWQICAVALTGTILVGCGGGGGGGSSSNTITSTSTTLSGTVAVGDPITGASIAVKCAAGLAISNSTTDSSGRWSADVANQTLPCAVQSSGGFIGGIANSAQYHSIAMTRGVVNITPMTDIFLAHWLQNANLGNWFTAANATTLNGLSTSQRDAALTRFRNAMPLLTGLQSVDPITSAFNAAAGDTMDDMLEAIKHARSATSSNHADDLHNVTQGNSIVVSNNYYSALVWKYRQTTSGASATGISYSSANIVTSAPGETYAAASEDESAFNLLNAERARCGYGYLSQDTRIDAAARAHADYQLINWTNSHYETFGNPGFTGQNGGARIGYQGYSWAAYGDNIAMKLGSNSKTGYGEKSVRDLLSAPFHSNSLLGFFRDVGLGIRNNVDAGSANSGAVTQINLAYTSGASKQEPASDTVLTYPCQGTTGVNYRLRNESPNPVPNRDLWNNPLV